MSHLIFLTGTPPSIAAGSGTWVGISVLRDAVTALGHEVTLLTPHQNGIHKRTLRRVLFNLRARRLAGNGADVLIGFDLDGVFVSSGRRRHIASIKGVLADEASHEKGLRRLGLILQAWLERIHVRRADGVVATSEYSRGRIAKFYGVALERIAVVPELIELAAWRKALDDTPIRPGPPAVLCVAHLYPRKSIDTLIRAFARLDGECVLRIVGIGPQREQLERLARESGMRDRIHFLGQLPFHELVAEYRNAAIFALPSVQEGFGIVFLEAMASSLPVIAARAAAVPEVVVDGVTGLLVEPEDVAGLTAALEKLLQQPELRRAFGTAGSRHVARFDAPVVAQRFLTAVRSAAFQAAVPPASCRSR